MRWLQNMGAKIKTGIRTWLDITPAQHTTFHLQEMVGFDANLIKNKIWYIGDPDKLSQFYSQLYGNSDNMCFWAAVSTAGLEIRKIHTGLPGIMVDSLTDIVMTNLDDIKVPDNRRDAWKEIQRENNFKDLLDTSIRECLYLGDGAFKISYDNSISKYPIIEWYPADRIEIVNKRGRLREVVFETIYRQKGREYVLFEHYGFGTITYELYRKNDLKRKVPLNMIPQTEKLIPVTFNSDLCLAFPMRFFKNPEKKERGKSIYDGKTDDFDALDEAWSQWMQAIRDGRSRKYIPDCLLSHDPETGEAVKPNAFDNAFIATEADAEEGKENKIQVTQPQIPHDSYCATYVTALDQCLQGRISPSTLGIDVKKLDNAEAQREKEKTTLYTIGKMIDVLQDIIPQVINTTFKVMDILKEQTPEESKVTIDFGEYSNPSFESQVETIGSAKSKGIMSNEAAVDELYGDTKDEAWKQEEINRLNAIDGIAGLEEPKINTQGLEVEDAEGKSISEGGGVLNGAQIGSLMNVIAMAKNKIVTRGEAISIISSTLGINREVAETYFEQNTEDAT